MRTRFKGLIAAGLFVAATPLMAAQAPPARFGFGPPPPSAELAKAPQTKGAKGDQERHYYFADAKQEMPYHLYVPKNYDPKVGAPLVVALHGYAGNQDYFFSLVKDLPALCDKYGFIFVAPMGYTTGNWYGTPMDVPRGPIPGAGGKPTPVPPGLPPGPPDGPRERQLSEKDTMNVVDLVRKEYKVDPSRIYLMGHSMGGAGTWHLAQKYADLWAAFAPMSGALSEADYNYAKLAKMPAMVAIGGQEASLVAAAKVEVAALKAAGGKATLVEVPNGTHMSMIPVSTPQILAFFAEQKKAKR